MPSARNAEPARPIVRSSCQQATVRLERRHRCSLCGLSMSQAPSVLYNGVALFDAPELPNEAMFRRAVFVIISDVNCMIWVEVAVAQVMQVNRSGMSSSLRQTLDKTRRSAVPGLSVMIYLT